MTSARLQHLTSVLCRQNREKCDANAPSGVRAAPTVTSFRSTHVGAPLLPGYISASSPVTPPPWATQMVALLKQQTTACEVFFAHYFDEHDGQMEMYPRWGGNDGPDDAIENLTHWPILYALGGGDSLVDMCHRAWEGHIRQYTNAKTTHVEFARDGMYYREFPTMFDWVHNGEGLTTFNLHGLMDPAERNFEKRVRRFSEMYMGEDPALGRGSQNYDKDVKIIRSLLNGSRGPMLRKATGLDWAGDPLPLAPEGLGRPEDGQDEVSLRWIAAHGESTFDGMIAHFEEYTDVVGDHPSNMVSTTLALNAFALTAEPAYRDWVLEYVDAWIERAEANPDAPGVLPSNVGLDGMVGSAAEGRWYGGCYGWGFAVDTNYMTGKTDGPGPRGGDLNTRNTVYLGIAGFGNALLLTGNRKYVDAWRKQLNVVRSNAKVIDGVMMYPQNFGEYSGQAGSIVPVPRDQAQWYDYSPSPYSQGAVEVWYWSMDPADLEWGSTRWSNFLAGNDKAYVMDSLSEDFEYVRSSMAGVRDDVMTTDTRQSDNPNHLNPASSRGAPIGKGTSLVQLMMGGLTPRHGFPLHCRLRYFDNLRHRPGMPEDVAALVTAMSDESTTVEIINTSQVEEKRLAIQGGAYGEHKIVSVTMLEEVHEVGSSYFKLRLAPGAGVALMLTMQRWAYDPTMAFPWDR